MSLTAVLANFGDLGVEAVEILRCFRCNFRFGRDSCKPRIEIGLVFPDGRQSGSIAGLRVVRKKGRSLVASLGKTGEHLFGSIEIEGPLAVQHFCGDFALLAVSLHERLARGNWVR